MSCDVVRTSQQQLCSETGSGTPCFISISKMNISRTTAGKLSAGFTRGSRNTFIDSMERVPTCSLLKSSVAICVCLFGNMFIGKNKNPFANNGEKGLKALQYFQDTSLSAGDAKNLKDDFEIKDEDGISVKRQSSIEQRRQLIERAEKKLQQLTSLHRDSWDVYRLLMTEDLEDSPLKENVKKIQLLLTRVTKFVTFAHGKLDTLKTCTLLELIEILEELEHVLKLTSDMRLSKGNHSQTSLEATEKESVRTDRDENYSNSPVSSSNRSVEQHSGKSLSSFSEGSEMSVKTVIDKYSKSRETHRKNTVLSLKHQRSPNRNRSILKTDKDTRSVHQLGCGDGNVKTINQIELEMRSNNSFRCKQRSIYAGMKHSISHYPSSSNIQQRVKSTISHIEALGKVETKIDKNRLEKIFGKIGRVEGETNIKKPNKTKLEQITREFVRIKDTIVRLIRINRSNKPILNEYGAEGDARNASPDRGLGFEKSYKTVTEYDNKLEQLNKKLEEIRTAYDLLRTISIGTLSHRSKRAEVRRLMTDLNTITYELNKIQPPFDNKTVREISHVNHEIFKIKEENKLNNCPFSGGDGKEGVSVGIDTSGTAGMQWPNPRYQAVLYNYDWDEQSGSHGCEDKQEGQETEEKNESSDSSAPIPGDKGTQTRIDTISSWIEKHKAGEVVYEDSCIVTIGQPVRRTKSVNIINQESRKIATLKLQCQSSESVVAVTKSKQNECRNRFMELLKVGRGFFERSCKRNPEKLEATENQSIEKENSQGECNNTNNETEQIPQPEENKESQVETVEDDKEKSASKGILTVRNVQTSYDNFLVKQDLHVDAPGGKSNYTCFESDLKVKEAVENALAGIESAYSLALREFIGRLNSQGINIRMDSSSKSTSTTGLRVRSNCSSYKYSKMESKISMFSYQVKKSGELNKEIDYISQISVDAISITSKSQSCSKKSSKRVPYPLSSRTQLAGNGRTQDVPEDDCLMDYISSFDNSYNSSILLIQNNNFK